MGRNDESFSWESQFKRTWDQALTKESGRGGETPIKRISPNTKRGIVRHLLVVVDMSEAAEERDFLPSRKGVMKEGVVKLYSSFQENNPLSTMGLSVISNGVCERFASIITDVSVIEEVFDKKMRGEGKYSLVSSIDSSYILLKDTMYLKEVLLIVSSLSFTDTEKTKEAVNKAVSGSIKVHSVHMTAEVSILKRLSARTGGSFGVALDRRHFLSLLESVTIPDELPKKIKPKMIKMGLPRSIEEYSICTCHLELTENGYECPFCRAKVCSIPTICPICENVLGTTIHLLKSLHYLDTVSTLRDHREGRCRVCLEPSHAMCTECGTSYCENCSDFVHLKLNFCAFCP